MAGSGFDHPAESGWLMHGMNAGERRISQLLALMFIVTPLLWVLDRAIAVMVLQILALVVVFLLVLQPGSFSRLDKLQAIAVAGIFASAALSLLPLPFALWEQLPGRADYAEMIRMLGGPENGWRQISIVPQATEKAIWLLVPPLVTFMAVMALSRKAIRKLLLVIVVLAVFQSLLGLLQYGAGIASFNALDRSPGHVATGTYLNRDHLAGFLEMTFPVMLALVAGLMGRHIGSRGSRGVRYWVSVEGNQALLYGLAALLVVLAIVFTRSRMGVMLTMIGLLCCLIAFSRRLGGHNVYGAYGTFLAIAVVLAIEIGLAPVLDRFTQDPMQDMRWEIYATAMQAVGQFFPLGSGAGTFGQVYPAFQIPHSDYFINRAHNDYLEWVFTAGLPAAILIVMVLYLYFRNWARLRGIAQWDTFHFIQVGSGIGIFLMLLHTFFDFNLHKPMNAVYFAFFLAVFMRNEVDRHEP